MLWRALHEAIILILAKFPKGPSPGEHLQKLWSRLTDEEGHLPGGITNVEFVQYYLGIWGYPHPSIFQLVPGSTQSRCCSPLCIWWSYKSILQLLLWNITAWSRHITKRESNGKAIGPYQLSPGDSWRMPNRSITLECPGLLSSVWAIWKSRICQVLGSRPTTLRNTGFIFAMRASPVASMHSATCSFDKVFLNTVLTVQSSVYQQVKGMSCRSLLLAFAWLLSNNQVRAHVHISHAHAVRISSW